MINRNIDVLLIEDNPHDEELILYVFKKYQLTDKVTVVRDGEQALNYLLHKGEYKNQTITPKLILLDIKLPKISGFGVLQEIKNNPRTSTIPVVVLTSSQEEQDVIQSYRLGVNAYVVKPVDYEQFTDAIRRLGVYWLFHNQPPEIKEG
jgi:CheY-like chemotaxis protein